MENLDKIRAFLEQLLRIDLSQQELLVLASVAGAIGLAVVLLAIRSGKTTEATDEHDADADSERGSPESSSASTTPVLDGFELSPDEGPSGSPSHRGPTAPVKVDFGNDGSSVNVDVGDEGIDSVEPFDAPEPATGTQARRAAPPPPLATTIDASAFRAGLQATRGNLISRLATVFRGSTKFDASILDDVEEVLLTADIGAHTASTILEALRTKLERGEISSADQAWAAIRSEAELILEGSGQGIKVKQSPTLVLVVGVNGAGKTTTIGKLASHLNQRGHSVLLAAGDTFRAAAVTQLQRWGERAGATVVCGKEGADPSSVIFDAIKQGQEQGIDVILADTAGRLQTKAPLMEELKKVGRTAEKALGRPADYVLLVLDATIGQNGIQQAELFSAALPVTGVVLTKLDGTAKGGAILGIVDRHKIPIEYVGVGEKVDDLKPFVVPAFLDALFAPADV